MVVSVFFLSCGAGLSGAPGVQASFLLGRPTGRVCTSTAVAAVSQVVEEGPDRLDSSLLYLQISGTRYTLSKARLLKELESPTSGP